MGIFSGKHEPSRNKAAGKVPSPETIPSKLLPLFIIGISLNTFGITLKDIGPLRWVLMAVGLGMVLTFVIKISQRKVNSSGSH